MFRFDSVSLVARYVDNIKMPMHRLLTRTSQSLTAPGCIPRSYSPLQLPRLGRPVIRMQSSDKNEQELHSSESRQAMNQYLHGEPVVEEEEDNGGNQQTDGHPTSGSKIKSLAKVTGAATGAVLGGALVAGAGLPLAVAGAVAGAAAGTIAGTAIGREWVRGEDIGSAMEFDQPGEHSPKRDNPHIKTVGHISVDEEGTGSTRTGTTGTKDSSL